MEPTEFDALLEDRQAALAEFLALTRPSSVHISKRPVSFDSQTPQACTVSGTTVTLVAIGTCTVQATQAGNTNYAAGRAVNQTFQVKKRPRRVPALTDAAAKMLVAPNIHLKRGARPGLL